MMDTVSSDYRGSARRAGGGFVNHDLFWNVLSPWGGHPPGEESNTIQARERVGRGTTEGGRGRGRGATPFNFFVVAAGI